MIVPYAIILIASMIHWNLDAETSIYPLEQKDSEDIYQLITRSRTHLDRWLRWSAAIQTKEDVHALVGQFQDKLRRGDGFQCGIWHNNHLAGAVVCWYIHPGNKNAEIGYWLGKPFTGKGLATRAAERALTYLFADVGLHRVEMQCGVANLKSRAVPERLGFTFEGVRRESHWITDRFVDHAVYGVLSSEWKNR